MTVEFARWPAVPDCYTGVWQRTLLEAPGVVPDVSSRVFWLQTRHWHGDLRLPADRPDFSRCDGLSATTLEQRLWLAGQQGFAGITEVRAVADVDPRAVITPVTTCQWHRHFDFQPPRRERDIGTMVFVDAGWQLEEYGLEHDYHETWRRLPESVGPTSAWTRAPREAGGGVELLLVSGACFFLQRARRVAWPPLPAGAALVDLVASGGMDELLDMELSFGRFDPPTGRCTVIHSTLPWREGTIESVGDRWQALAGPEPALPRK